MSIKQDDAYKKIFVRSFNSLLADKGWKSSDLARKLGVHRNNISAYTRGDSYPSVPILVQISELCNVSIDRVVLGRDPYTIKESLQQLEEYQERYLVKSDSRISKEVLQAEYDSCKRENASLQSNIENLTKLVELLEKENELLKNKLG